MCFFEPSCQQLLPLYCNLTEASSFQAKWLNIHI
jgi:hypothetical protein